VNYLTQLTSLCLRTMCPVISLMVSAYGKQAGSAAKQILHWKVSFACSSFTCRTASVWTIWSPQKSHLFLGPALLALLSFLFNLAWFLLRWSAHSTCVDTEMMFSSWSAWTTRTNRSSLKKCPFSDQRQRQASSANNNLFPMSWSSSQPSPRRTDRL